MNITTDNYYEVYNSIDHSTIPESLKKSHQLVNRMTEKAGGWNQYHSNKVYKRVTDLYFKKLSEFLDSQKPTAPQKPKASKTVRKPVKKRAANDKQSKANEKESSETPKPKRVELIDLELKFIRRFVNLHGKPKTANQILLFINALQKAIVERIIRKSSAYASEIREIQKELIQLYEEAKKKDFVVKKITTAKRNHYLTLLGKQIESPAIGFVKRYMSYQGQLLENSKAKKLHNKIADAINESKITLKDKYYPQIKEILSTLKAFVKNNKIAGILDVKSKTLNGLNGVGFIPAIKKEKGKIMKSTELIKMEFDKLNFKGKWLDFIGNPSRGFTAMTFGRPKMGKSYLMIEFAGYLVRNHGTVLYAAKEEGLDDTLKQKLQDKNVAHPDLFVSDYLPEDLSMFDFVFLDSVTKLKLSPDDLENLSKKYPTTSFIQIFQTTKQGNFRGANDHQHDVDVVIEVYEKGKARQFGRFNQGAEISVFNSAKKAPKSLFK